MQMGFGVVKMDYLVFWCCFIYNLDYFCYNTGECLFHRSLKIVLIELSPNPGLG